MGRGDGGLRASAKSQVGTQMRLLVHVSRVVVVSVYCADSFDSDDNRRSHVSEENTHISYLCGVAIEPPTSPAPTYSGVQQALPEKLWYSWAWVARWLG